MKRAAILLADGFEEVEALTPADFLRRAGIDVTLVGVSGPVVEGGQGIQVEADETIEEFSGSLDALILPGGKPGAVRLSASEEVVKLLRQVDNDSGYLAAICAAPAVVLGPHGFLKGKSYTCYPGFEKDVADGRFVQDRVFTDGTLITSRGPGTAAEFAVTLIEKLAGPGAARKVAQGTLQFFA